MKELLTQGSHQARTYIQNPQVFPYWAHLVSTFSYRSVVLGREIVRTEFSIGTFFIEPIQLQLLLAVIQYPLTERYAFSYGQVELFKLHQNVCMQCAINQTKNRLFNVPIKQKHACAATTHSSC